MGRLIPIRSRRWSEMAAFMFSYRDANGSSGVLVRADTEDQAREKFADCCPDGQVESVRRVA